ncbi:MAG: beta-ketoacyl synthase N-terminal-like domain-containing protein [Verrucomicrobiales bacterium]|nr:beta-ketoacyl synthase N-terminal-like domain-containing protein [Verrucomicrobiales bacterium]
MNQSSVVITGMGFVSSIGCDTEAVVDHLRRGRHGFSRVELRQGVDLPIKVVGTVPGYAFPSPDVRDWVLPPESHVDLCREPSLPPHGVYAVDAVEQAIAQAGLTSDQLGDGSTGLFGASSGSPMLLRHHLSVYDKDGSQRGASAWGRSLGCRHAEFQSGCSIRYPGSQLRLCLGLCF